jgi:predicted dienelactone hydrolase
MRVKTTILLVLASLFLSCASDPDRPDKTKTANEEQPKNYRVESGPLAVGAIPDGALVDSQRKKDLALSVEYPIAPGSYPVILFSHGFGGSNRGYVGLSAYWASYGYVVIKPSHADSTVGGAMRDSSDAVTAQTEVEWKNRVRDLVAIIDALPSLEEKYPELKGKLDLNRIGVGGDSYGAFTALLAGGVDVFRSGRIHLADPRVKAVVAMSPQGPSERFGLTKDSFATLTVPTLFMTGSRDLGAEGEDPAWRRQAFELSPAGAKTFISIEGATHSSFAGRFAEPGERETDRTMDPFANPNDPYGQQRTTQSVRNRGDGTFQRERSTFATIKMASLAFWDQALKADARGSEFLQRLSGRTDVVYAVK